MHNIILNTDSYKLSHYKQYPPNTTEVFSYIESRGGKLPDLVFFGLQALIKEYLETPITRENIEEAEDVAMAHLGFFNREGWEHILNKHGGYLPLEITAIPEGTVTSAHIPVVQVHNTDPKAFWLPSYVEPPLLRGVWYPTTVASLSYASKKIIYNYLKETSDNPDVAIDFALHDFGARGATTEEAAAIGGAAHLLNFKGSDTLSGILAAKRYYHEKMAAFSIAASEHSTTTAWTKEFEKEAYKNMINQFSGKDKVLAFVIDSYDAWNALDNIIGTELHDLIKNNGGRIVVRPDSGDPIAFLPKVIEKLMAKFGSTLNTKGYRVLPEYIRVIQGDGITLESLPRILENMKIHNLATENTAFGMGGGLLQKVDRDTMKWAQKASYAVVNGVGRDIFKDPATDPGKRSKAGRYAVIQEDNIYKAVRIEAVPTGCANIMRPVYSNGKLLIDENFADIRQRVNEHFSMQFKTSGKPRITI